MALTRHYQSNSNTDAVRSPRNTPKRFVVAGLIVGGIVTSAVAANASTPTTPGTPQAATTASTSYQRDSVLNLGLGLDLNLRSERGTELAAPDADRVRAAVHAKDQNMTIEQMTSDSHGGFQARGFTTDGSRFALQLNASFNVVNQRYSGDANQNNDGDRGLFGNHHSNDRQGLLGGLL